MGLTFCTYELGGYSVNKTLEVKRAHIESRDKQLGPGFLENLEQTSAGPENC